MRTIKLIDLLINLSKGIQNPEKIKYDEQIWKLRKSGDYVRLIDDDYYLFDNHLCFCEETLNIEVEIIEDEPTQIEKYYINEDLNKCTDGEIMKICCDLANKLNEVIRAVNELKKGSDNNDK